MKRNFIHIAFLLIIGSCTLLSCSKEFLDKKPDKSLLVPVKTEELRAILDNISVMNEVPALNMLASDDYYTTEAGLKGYSTAPERNSYLWLADTYEGFGNVADWNSPFKQVFCANIVLEGIENLSMASLETEETKNLKGTALFFRAWAYYHLAQLFAAPFDQRDASEKPGIPVRLSADVNKRPDRGTVAQTYAQIIKDLETSLLLLPVKVTAKSRPNKPAAFAMLARVYLTMGDYEQADNYATECLKLYDTLIDYHTLTASAARPLPRSMPNGNDEVLFNAVSINYSSISGSKAASTLIEEQLFASYATNDLRKSILFNNKGNGVVNFKGNYTGLAAIFAGLATDEVYLISAECKARMGETSAAMDQLNTLLKNRYQKTSFIPWTASDGNVTLDKILTERRKELVCRGTRWTDLRRLNKEAKYAKTLIRVIGTETYTLIPNSNRYVFPIPDSEINNGGIQQNPR